MAEGYSPKLPLTLSDLDGAFALNKNINTVVKQNIKMLFLTSPGERMMDARFGVGLRNYLHEPLSASVKSTIRERILSQMNTYIPAVSIVSLTVSDDLVNNNAIRVKMIYNIGSSTNQSIEITV
jgi:phage baseplate assembly protein W